MLFRLIIVGIFVANCNRLEHEIFTVGSLYYYVLIVIFVALEEVDK